MTAQERNNWLLILVLVCSGMLFFNFWQQQQQRREEAGQQQSSPQAPAAPPAGGDRKPSPELPADVPLKEIEVRTDEMAVKLSSLGASIEKLDLLKYRFATGMTDPLPVLDSSPARDGSGPRRSMVLRDFGDGLDFERWPFRLERDDGGFAGEPLSRVIVFSAAQGDVEVRKTYTFRPAGFDIDLAVTVTNRGARDLTVNYKLIGASRIRPDEPPGLFPPVSAKLAGRDQPDAGLETRTVAAAEGPNLKRKKPEKLALSKKYTEWAALRARYFGAILMPRDPSRSIEAFAEPTDMDETDNYLMNLAVGLRCTSFQLRPRESATQDYRLRVGPQDAAQLEAYVHEDEKKTSRELVGAVDFSAFYWDWFSKPSRWLVWLLNRLQSLVGNYGVAIFLLTLVIKLALHPLQRKGQIIMSRSQEQMQSLAPKLKALQEQHKNDPSKLHAAQMRLYKEEGVNPAGFALGCLPMVIQMPVWIALYGAIRGAFELRQEHFLWVADLSRPDTVWAFGFWPGQLNILPIVYAGLMVLQSFAQPLPADPQARQQQMMMRFMPLIFFVFIYKLPSAFVLYFASNAVLGYLETLLVKKQIARMKAREAAKAASAGEPPAGEKAADAPPAPVDPKAFWASEGERKRGKGGK